MKRITGSSGTVTQPIRAATIAILFASALTSHAIALTAEGSDRSRRRGLRLRLSARDDGIHARVMTNVAKPEGTRAPMGQFGRMREYPNASLPATSPRRTPTRCTPRLGST